MSERTRSIERWLDINLKQKKEPYERMRGVHDGHGIWFVGAGIEYSNGNGPAAHLVRDSTSLKGGPLLRMALPNQITYRRFREIYRIATDKSVPVVVAPRSVLAQADIRTNTIKLIATERRMRMFRPPQQVIEATVWPNWDSKPRTAYFLSGYDLAERGLSYFFCELPTDTAPESVEHAYQMLQPESVKRAHAQRRKVYRQGDMFFIRAKDEEGPTKILSDVTLFETNHRVSEGGFNKDGLLMVRGKVQHRPFNRGPDHRTLVLPGRGWYIAVQNAVRVVDNTKTFRR
jgi:hypothetical protein